MTEPIDVVVPEDVLPIPQQQTAQTKSISDMTQKLMARAGVDEDDVEINDDIPEDIISEEKPEKKEVKFSKADQDAAFKEMRVKAEAAEKRLKEMEDQLKLRPSITSDEYKKLEEERNNLRARVAQIDISVDPEFQSTYSKPITDKATQIASYVKQFGGDDKSVASILNPSASIKDRMAIVKSSAPDAVAFIAPLLADFDKAREAMINAIKDHANTSKKLMAEKVGAVTGPAFDDGVKKLQVYPFLRKSATNEEWNKSVDKRYESAKELLKKQDHATLVEMALKASIVDDYALLFKKERDARIKAEEELGKRKRSLPRVSTSQSQQSQQQQSQVKPGIKGIMQELMSRAENQ